MQIAKNLNSFSDIESNKSLKLDLESQLSLLYGPLKHLYPILLKYIQKWCSLDIPSCYSCLLTISKMRQKVALIAGQIIRLDETLQIVLTRS